MVGSKRGGAVTPHTNRSGPAAGPGEDPLDRLMAERGTHLHAAIALTGGRAEAEDLLQVRLAVSHAEQTDFGWLKPTPANLSLLQVKVPAGFRNVQVPPRAQLFWVGL